MNFFIDCDSTEVRNQFLPITAFLSYKIVHLMTRASFSSDEAAVPTSFVMTDSTKKVTRSAPKKKPPKQASPTKANWEDSPTLHNFSPKKPKEPQNTSEPVLIAYIHELSPSKRNRGNTVDYCTLTLQKSATENQEALLYSLAKRTLLLQSQTSRTPVKIRNYALTDDKLKVVINDMANISTPEKHEYNFQYADIATPELIPVTILEVLNSNKEWDMVTVRGKVMSVTQAKTVGSPIKRLNLLEAIIRDETWSIPLDVWESAIGDVQEGLVYEFARLQVSFYDHLI